MQYPVSFFLQFWQRSQNATIEQCWWSLPSRLLVTRAWSILLHLLLMKALFQVAWSQRLPGRFPNLPTQSHAYQKLLASSDDPRSWENAPSPMSLLPWANRPSIWHKFLFATWRAGSTVPSRSVCRKLPSGTVVLLVLWTLSCSTVPLTQSVPSSLSLRPTTKRFLKRRVRVGRLSRVRSGRSTNFWPALRRVTT